MKATTSFKNGTFHQPHLVKLTLVNAAEAPAAKPKAVAPPKYSKNYQRKYRTTVDNCQCPAHVNALRFAAKLRRNAKTAFDRTIQADPCKHMLLERLRVETQMARVKNMLRASKQGLNVAEARLDTLFSALEYHREFFTEYRMRENDLAMELLSDSIIQWEKFYGRSNPIPPRQRINIHFGARRTLGKSVIPA